jgi:hypothetical protein
MKARRSFVGILSAVELAFVCDETFERSFESLILETGYRNRDVKSRAALAWKTARTTTVRDWIREHPGTRPRCWWAFDAPEPLRAVVAGTGAPLLFDVHYGRAEHWHDWSGDLAIESQAAYLRRHGLLTAAELRRVPADGWDPERIFDSKWKFNPQ